MFDEDIIDSFAGGGGASTGIEMALGRSPDVAINHDDAALAMHAANHPNTVHLSSNIWHVDPATVRPGRRIGLLWASPDCTHHSKAKGGVPIREAGKASRDLGWVIVNWARVRKPRVIIVENVEEWQKWGPLVEVGSGLWRPDPARIGETFREWVAALRGLGYAVEWREERACWRGAPTIRKRLFVIARCDGRPIVWPRWTHGDPKKSEAVKPWRTAAEIIDWSRPSPSIFMTREEARATGIRVQRPLADKTMGRIARGVKRYVLDAAEPFIIPTTHAGDLRSHPVSEPLRTQTTAHRGEHALVTPFLARTAHGEVDKNGRRRGRGDLSVEEPLPTILASSDAAVVSPFLVPRYGERDGQAARAMTVDAPLATVVPTANGAALVAAFLAKHYGDTGQRPGSPLGEPVNTITAQDHHALIAAHMLNLKGSDRRAGPIDVPAPTFTAGGNHAAMVTAFLMKYYGEGGQWQGLGEPIHTVTTKDRLALVAVTIAGEPWVIVDIGMRMLTPRERFNAHGFPPDYKIAVEFEGKPLSGEAQGRMVGNSVCPPHAAALVAANCPELRVAA